MLGLGAQPQQRQHPAHLAEVAQRVAHHLIGDARPVKCFDQRAPLRAQPVEHCNLPKALHHRVAVGHAARIQREMACPPHQLLNALHHILGFGAVGGRGVDRHLDLGGEVRQQPPRRAIRVARDHLRGRVQQRLRRTVAALQGHGHRAGEFLGKLVKIRRVGPAKAVDRLVGVADGAHIGSARG